MANDNDIELQNDGPDEPAPKVTEQFPALAGTEEGRAEEVAERSVDGSDGTRFVKVFRVDRLGVSEDDPSHEANKAVVAQEAMQRGLHARGEVRFDGAEDHVPDVEPGRRSFPYSELTYSVETVPASVDSEPTQTTTPTDVVTDAEPEDKKPAAKRSTSSRRKG